MYLKEISTKLDRGDLNISNENLAYIKAYREYESYDFISYINPEALDVEQQKAATIAKQDLSYTEQETPLIQHYFLSSYSSYYSVPLLHFYFFLSSFIKLFRMNKIGLSSSLKLTHFQIQQSITGISYLF